MTDQMQKAVNSLLEKMAGQEIDGSIKFEIESVGSIVIIDGTVRESEEETDCTLKGTFETFNDIFSGDISSTSAFMSGKLKIEGSMGIAMRYNEILS